MKQFWKYRRLLSSLVIAAVLVVTLCSASAVSGENENTEYVTRYSVNMGLSSEQILQRFEEINRKYDVGDELEPVDVDFVKTYATLSTEKPNGIQPRLDVNFITGEISPEFEVDYTNDDAQVRVVVHGNTYLHQNTLVPSDQRFGGTFTATGYWGGNRIESMTLSVDCTCFGIAGESGLIKAYEGTVEATANNTNKATIDKIQQYTVIGATYTTINGYVDVDRTNLDGHSYSFRINQF